jgi:hypothetical protein
MIDDHSEKHIIRRMCERRLTTENLWNGSTENESPDQLKGTTNPPTSYAVIPKL